MVSKIVHPDLKDKTEYDEGLYAVSCGYYEVKTRDLSCIRENGRSDYFLFYVLKGKSTFVINGVRQTAKEGDIVFYDYNDRQEYSHLSGCGTQIYWLHFNGAEAKKLLRELNVTRSMVFHTKSNISEYFETIIKELTYKKSFYYKAVAGSIYLLLCNALRKNEVVNAKLDYVISLMNSMENNGVSLEEYAKICNLSKSQFIRSFKNDIIIKNAKWYLSNTNCSISEIAYVLKFENIYYFSTMFKNHTGLSPTDYRLKTNKN